MTTASPWNGRQLFSGASSDAKESAHWQTPPEVFDPLHAEFDFDLDVSASAGANRVPRFLGPGSSLATNALIVDWISLGKVIWANLPYTRTLSRWFEKVLAASTSGATVVVLILARTDTKWWHRYAMRAAEQRFIEGRISFLRASGARHVDKNGRSIGAPAPSVVLVFRPEYSGKPEVSSWRPPEPNGACTIPTATIHPPSPRKLTMAKSAPVTVTRVRSRLQGDIDVALGRCTLITGPNEAGKTAILRSVELALTARASDINGRADVGRAADLMALAPGRAGELFTEVDFSDGTKARWATSGTEGRAATPEHTVPQGVVLPLRDVLGAIKGSVETARKFFLSAACGAVAEASVTGRVPEPLRPRYSQATQGPGAPKGDAIASLLYAQESAGKRKLEANARHKAAGQVVEQLGRALPPPVMEEDVKAGVATVAAAKAVFERAVSAAGRATQRAAQAMQDAGTNATHRAELEADVAQAKVHVQAAQQALDALIPPPPASVGGEERAALGRALIAVLDKQAAKATAAGSTGCACVVCGATTNAAILATRTAAVHAALDATLAMDAAATRLLAAYRLRRAAAEATVNAMEAQLRDAHSALTAASGSSEEGLDFGVSEAISEAADDFLSTLDGDLILAGDSALGVEEARAALMAAEATLAAQQDTAAKWAQVQKARNTVVVEEQEANAWGQVAEALSTVVSELLDGSVAAFVQRVQKYLPENDVFHLRLREGTREVFQFGLVRPGGVDGGEVLHTALSGAAWARVTAAVACACVPEGTKCAVIIPEDRAFDAATLTEVMRALGKTPWQVLMASPVKPAGRTPAGWTVIDLPARAFGAGAPKGETAMTSNPSPSAGPMANGSTVPVTPMLELIADAQADATLRPDADADADLFGPPGEAEGSGDAPANEGDIDDFLR